MAEKSIVKNSVFNVFYRLLNMLFPLVTSVYISHILQADGVGRVSYAQNIAQYFVLLAPLGIVSYGTRELAKVRVYKVDSDRLFSELFVLNFISTIAFSAVYYSLILFSGFFDGEKALFLVTGMLIILNVFNVEWYYQAYEEYVYIAIRSAAVKILSLVAIILFVRSKQDYLVYALIYVLGFGGNYVFNVYNLWRRGVRLHLKGLSIARHLKPIFILLSSNIAIEIYVLIGTTILGALCAESTVGYYNNAAKLVKMVSVTISSIGMVLLPRLSYYKSLNRIDECNVLVNKVTSVMLYLALPCGVGLFLLAEPIILLLFGETFAPAAITAKIATILVYVLPFSNLFGTQVLLTFNQEKKFLICTIAGAVSNLILNILLIPTLQHNGAMLATIITETLVTILMTYNAGKYVSLNISAKMFIKTVTATGIMGIVVFFVKGAFASYILQMIVSVSVGLVVYILFGFCARNPLVAELVTLIKRRRSTR